MRWAVLGSNGLLGHQLTLALAALGREFSTFNRNDFSVEMSVEQLARLLPANATWVNCVGFTNVDLAEAERDLAFQVNAIFPGNLAQAAYKSGSRLVHISTDYVFGGDQKESYSPDDKQCPVNTYGESKAQGEFQVMKSMENYQIIRTAWLYGLSTRGFPQAIARSVRANGSVNVVNDQIGQPTWVNDVAEKIIELSDLNIGSRIFHAVSSGEASRFEYAKAVVECMGLSSDLVHPISSGDFPTVALRPRRTVLSNSLETANPIGNWHERLEIAFSSIMRNF